MITAGSATKIPPSLRPFPAFVSTGLPGSFVNVTPSTLVATPIEHTPVPVLYPE